MLHLCKECTHRPTLTQVYSKCILCSHYILICNVKHFTGLTLFSSTSRPYPMSPRLSPPQLTLPPWPMYRQNPLSWQPALPETTGETLQKPQENLKKKKHK
uniref:Uncharacterized protein n=1 Tax=Oncorhynchus tshawytscha TaxID=74940 RepID=A0AAZ3NPK0_ONCTS